MHLTAFLLTEIGNGQIWMHAKPANRASLARSSNNNNIANINPKLS